jgi:hypothetical protein
MQKDPPSPVSDTFQKNSEINAEQRLRLNLEKLPDQDKQGFRKLRQDQELATQHLKETLEEERERKISRLSREILDHKMDANKLDLRPKGLPTESRAALARKAREEAEIKVDQSNQQKLSLAEARQFEAQYKFIENAKLRGERVKEFNSRNGQEKSRDNGRDGGNER